MSNVSCITTVGCNGTARSLSQQQQSSLRSFASLVCAAAAIAIAVRKARTVCQVGRDILTGACVKSADLLGFADESRRCERLCVVVVVIFAYVLCCTLQFSSYFAHLHYTANSARSLRSLRCCCCCVSYAALGWFVCIRLSAG